MIHVEDPVKKLRINLIRRQNLATCAHDRSFLRKTVRLTALIGCGYFTRYLRDLCANPSPFVTRVQLRSHASELAVRLRCGATYAPAVLQIHDGSPEGSDLLVPVVDDVAPQPAARY